MIIEYSIIYKQILLFKSSVYRYEDSISEIVPFYSASLESKNDLSASYNIFFIFLFLFIRILLIPLSVSEDVKLN